MPTLFHYIAPIVGIFSMVIGFGAVLKPAQMSKKFGITASGPALPYVVSTGIRDVFMGLTVLVLFFAEEWPLLGAIHLGIGMVAVCDFLVVRAYGDKKTSLVHLASAIVVLVYGFWLIR